VLALWEYFWPQADWDGLKPTPQPFLKFRVEEIGPGMYITRVIPE
jgi:hypothetical protein